MSPSLSAKRPLTGAGCLAGYVFRQLAAAVHRHGLQSPPGPPSDHQRRSQPERQKDVKREKAKNTERGDRQRDRSLRFPAHRQPRDTYGRAPPTGRLGAGYLLPCLTAPRFFSQQRSPYTAISPVRPPPAPAKRFGEGSREKKPARATAVGGRTAPAATILLWRGGGEAEATSRQIAPVT